VLTGELNIGLHILDTLLLHGDQHQPSPRVQAAFARALKVQLQFCSVSDPFYFDTDTDQHCRQNTDPDPIPIQSGSRVLMTKN
jgi:hypothetical protein